MAKRRVKGPTIAQEVQALKISMNLMKQEMLDLSPKLGRLQVAVDGVRNKVEVFLERSPTNWPVIEQFNQMAAAVNKMAAYAAAMDETKQTMIKLTSRRIDRLDKRLNKLRVRIKRLTEE